MRLFELCGEDRDFRFSPFVWRARMALAHKGIDVECVPCRFSEKEPFAESGSKLLPVIEDNGKWLNESWDIAVYLEETYPDGPTLFGGAMGLGLTKTFADWSAMNLMFAQFLIAAPDVPKHQTAEDAETFRRSRAEKLGFELDSLIPKREQNIAKFRSGVKSLEATLKGQPYLCGDAPGFADYILFSIQQWVRLVSDVQTLTENSPIRDHTERVGELFDGLGNTAYRRSRAV